MKKEKGRLVVFRRDGHRYLCLPDGTEYTSVSKAFKKFENTFDADAVAEKKALIDMFPKEYAELKKIFRYDDPRLIETLRKNADPEKLILAAEKIKQTWKQKAERKRNLGTQMHQTLENIDKNKKFTWSSLAAAYLPVIYHNTPYDNAAINDNLALIPDGYYPEMLLFNHQHRKAGTADAVAIKTIQNTRYAYIKDYKSDDNINYKPEFFDPKKGFRKLKHQLAHLNDCNLVNYSIKMSTYALMLEQFGFKIAKLQLQSLKIYLDPATNQYQIINTQPINLPYRRYEAEILLKS